MQRYTLEEKQYGTGYMVSYEKNLVEDDDGEWVKYSDIASQAPRQALTDARIHKIATEHGMYEQHDNARPSAATVESFAKAIEVASGPNAALVEALRELASQGYGTATEKVARAALAAVGVEP